MWEEGRAGGCLRIGAVDQGVSPGGSQHMGLAGGGVVELVVLRLQGLGGLHPLPAPARRPKLTRRTP